MAYKEDTFGYWWTVIKGNPDIKGKVYKGDIVCVSNNLISLEGSPKEVKGNFGCDDNNLKSLEGGPEKVSGYFNCADNNLESLKGAPKEVGRNFNCEGNELLKDVLDIFKIDIKKKFLCDIMSDKEYKEGRKLYLKLKDLDKVKKIYKLKDKMR